MLAGATFSQPRIPNTIRAPANTRSKVMGSRPARRPPAQDPETVISNLVTIVYGNISGSYPDLFTEDFEFVPDPEDLDFINNQYGPGIYLDWFKPVEVSVADQLFDRLAKALLDLEEIDIAEQTDTTYVAYYEYKLDILPHGDTWRYYYGIAHLHLRLSPEDNFWYINRWDDFRPQDIPEDSRGTWGLLKGEIRATT